MTVVKRKFRKLINDPKLFMADSKLIKMVSGDAVKEEVKVVQASKEVKTKQNTSAASTKFRNQTENRSVLSMKYVQQAQLDFSNGDFPEAIENIDMAVAINPNNAIALVEASKIRSTLDEKDFAYSYARKAYTLNSDSNYIKANIADVALAHGEYSKEVEEWFQALMLVSEDGEQAKKFLSYKWEKQPASLSIASLVERFLKPAFHDPQAVAMLGSYMFDAGAATESLRLARALLDRGEGKRLKKYPRWYAYCSKFYPLVKNLNDTRTIDLTSKFEKGEDELVNRIKSAGRVVVVGNSPRETGKRLGASIDSADLIIRFNNFPNGKEFDADYGKRCDIWVRSVGSWVEERNPEEFKHIVIAGTNLLGRGFNMAHFMGLLESGVEASVFNRSYHYELVQLLNGPPSAGLMMLYMVYKIKGSLQSGDVFGFGFIDQLEEGVTNIGSSPAGVRHHWHRELELYESMLKGSL